MSENITSNNTRRAEQLKAFERLLDVLDELRVKCPWDKKQTNESLRPNTIEETYELCDALMKVDKKNICKSWAMCYFTFAFTPKIGSETGRFRYCRRLQPTVRQTYLPPPSRISAERERRQAHRDCPASERAMGTVETERERWQQVCLSWCTCCSALSY